MANKKKGAFDMKKIIIVVVVIAVICAGIFGYLKLNEAILENAGKRASTLLLNDPEISALFIADDYWPTVEFRGKDKISNVSLKFRDIDSETLPQLDVDDACGLCKFVFTKTQDTLSELGYTDVNWLEIDLYPVDMWDRIDTQSSYYVISTSYYSAKHHVEMYKRTKSGIVNCWEEDVNW